MNVWISKSVILILCSKAKMQTYTYVQMPDICINFLCVVWLSWYVFSTYSLYYQLYFQPFTFSVFLNVYFSPVALLYISGGIEGDMLAALAPPVHLSGERLGWTMLFCMVTDFRRGRLQVSWRSASEGHLSSFPTSLVLSSKHHGRGAVAVITVATSDWPSYSCSVNPRRHHKGLRRLHTTPSGGSAAHPKWNPDLTSVKSIPDLKKQTVQYAFFFQVINTRPALNMNTC